MSCRLGWRVIMQAVEGLKPDCRSLGPFCFYYYRNQTKNIPIASTQRLLHGWFHASMPGSVCGECCRGVQFDHLAGETKHAEPRSEQRFIPYPHPSEHRPLLRLRKRPQAVRWRESATEYLPPGLLIPLQDHPRSRILLHIVSWSLVARVRLINTKIR